MLFSNTGPKRSKNHHVNGRFPQRGKAMEIKGKGVKYVIPLK